MTRLPTPTTRHSLLVRLRDAGDQLAWDEFFAIYQPLIYRLARSRGFQDADASEIVQEVLLIVSRSLDSYVPQRDGGTFRGWLATVTRHHALNRLRGTAPRAIGGTSFDRRLDQLTGDAGASEAEEREFEYECRRQTFLWAAGELKSKFSESNWRAFWMTCVEGVSVADAAQQLGMSVGLVYVARCRVIARIRETVQRLTEETSR